MAVFGEDISETDAVILLLQNSPEIQNAEIDINIGFIDKKIAATPFNTGISLNSNRVLGDDISGVFTETRVSKMFTTGTSIGISAGSIELDFGGGMFPDSENRAASINVRQSFLQNAFGKASRRIGKIADASLIISQLSADMVKEELILLTIQFYWNYVIAVETVKAEETRNRYYHELYNLVMKKSEDGTAEKRDVLITKSALLQSANNLQLAVYNKENLEWRLRLLISPQDTMDIIPVFEESEFDISIEELLQENIVIRLLSRRPDIRILAQQLKIQELSSVMETSNALPALDLLVAYGTDSFNYSNVYSYIPLEDRGPGYMVGILFSYTLGGNENAGNAEKAFLQSVKLQNSLRKKRREVVLEYIDSLRRFSTARSIFEVSKEILFANKEKVENEFSELKKGRSSFETIVEFENQYITTYLSHYRSLRDYRVSIAELRKSANRLLDFYKQKIRLDRE